MKCPEPNFGSSRLSRTLVTAYTEARYFVKDGERSHEVRIHRNDEGLSHCLAEHGVESAALITAYNPSSRRRGLFANRYRQDALERLLASSGSRWLPTLATGEGWPAEPGLLLLGADRALGSRVARRYGQNAWVLLARGRPPELVLLR